MARAAKKVGTPLGILYAEVKLSQADGSVIFSFPTGLFKSPPVCSLTVVSTDGRMYSVALSEDPTTTSAKAFVRRTIKLPSVISTLGALLNYDTSVAVQAKVHLIARQP